MRSRDITSCFYVLGCSQRSSWSKMPAQREAWCNDDVPRAETWVSRHVLDSVRFSAATSCQHASDMFVRDDVTCGSLLAFSLAFPSRWPFVLARKGNWYRRWSRCRRVEDAHVQLFGLCRRVATTLFPAIENGARNPNLYISTRWEHEKCSLVSLA